MDEMVVALREAATEQRCHILTASECAELVEWIDDMIRVAALQKENIDLRKQLLKIRKQRIEALEGTIVALNRQVEVLEERIKLRGGHCDTHE